jgi:acyl carrier protein phosphodiesterase
MNYLAHLALSYPDPGLIAGNYLGDIITRKETKTLNPILLPGLEFHKWIDSYSNNSIPLKEINNDFHPLIHKYAPVASDIICDYLLYLSWKRYYTISFQDFSDYIYKSLQQYSEMMPARIAIICNNMIDHKWLSQYQSLDGLESVLRRTNKKTKFPVDLTLILPVLNTNKDKFILLFNEFYADCKKQSEKLVTLQNEGK